MNIYYSMYATMHFQPHAVVEFSTLRKWQADDAQLLAKRYGFSFPGASGTIPSPSNSLLAVQALLAARSKYLGGGGVLTQVLNYDALACLLLFAPLKAVMILRHVRAD